MEKLQSKDDPICSQVGKAIYSEIRKSLRSYESVRSSSSPRSTSLHRRPDLLRFGSLHLLKLYEESVITFCGSKLVSLKWFLLYTSTSDGSKSYLFRQQGKLVWTEMVRYFESMLIFGSRLQAPQFPRQVSIKWINFYMSAFDGSHSYLFKQQKNRIDWMKMGAFFHASLAGYMTEKLASFSRVLVEEMFVTIDFCILNHTKTVIWVADWMRISAFFFDSSAGLLNEELLSLPRGEAVQKMSLTVSSCILDRVKTGIWVIALKLVGYSLYKLVTYEGTIQTQDARQAELFFSQICKNGSWDYKVIDQMHPKDRTNSDFIRIWALVAPPAGVPIYLPAEPAPCPKPQALRRQRDEDEESRPTKKIKASEYLPHPCYRCVKCKSDIVPIHWVEEVENFQNHDPKSLLRWNFPMGVTLETGRESTMVARGTESYIVYDVKCRECKLTLGFLQVSFVLLLSSESARKRIGLCHFYKAQLN